jgi:hypothetical protein
MSDELKLLLISMGLFMLVLSVLIFNSKYECHEVRYQNLTGTHSKQVCKEK